MLYIVNIAHNPNMASCNRLLGYYAALDEMAIDTTVVFLLPDSQKSKIDVVYRCVKIVYMWDEGCYDNKIFRTLSFYNNIRKLLKMIRLGDVVYTYSINKVTTTLLRVKGIRVFAEIAEHPSLMGKIGFFFSIGRKELMQVVRKLDGLFVISESLRDYFIIRGIPPEKVHIVNMTVDTSRFIGLKKELQKEKYIAYCGTVSNSKDGVDELIKAFSLVAQKINDIKLYIIGNTPKTCDRTRNLALVESLGLKDRIVFTGVVCSQEMPQLLKNAEVLLLARPDGLQAKYGFPTKLGEYLLTENPVVVTKVGDIPKFLKDGESALLAEERNVSSFSSKVIWALEHPEESAIIGKEGLRVAIKEFNSKTETAKMVKTIYG